MTENCTMILCPSNMWAIRIKAIYPPMCTVLLPKSTTQAKCTVLVHCAPRCTSAPNWVHRCTKFNTLMHLFSAVTRTLVTLCFVFKFWTVLFLIKVSFPKTLFQAFLVLFRFISFEEPSLSFPKLKIGVEQAINLTTLEYVKCYIKCFQ